jgi:hypothetical protein
MERHVWGYNILESKSEKSIYFDFSDLDLFEIKHVSTS